MSPRIAASIEPRLLSGHSIWARVRVTREVDDVDVPELLVLPALDALPLDALLALAPPLEPVDVELVPPAELPPPERPLLAVWAQADDATARTSSNVNAKTSLMPG